MNADVFHVFEKTGVWKFNIAVVDYNDFYYFKEYNPDATFEFFDRFNVEYDELEELIKAEDEYYTGIHKIKR